MRQLEIPILLTLFAASASAQSLNVRTSGLQPPPSPSYGAATGQAGVWNSYGPVLVDLSGAATSVTLADNGVCDNGLCSFTGFGSDVAALFKGFLNGDCFQFNHIFMSGLQSGHYVLTAMDSPCQPYAASLQVSLSDGSYFSAASMGGTYAGSFDTMTLGSFEFQLAQGVVAQLSNIGYASLSAFQLAKIEPPAVFCTSKVNSQGCTAKIAAIGNTASLSGASPFHVIATDVVNDVPGLLFYGFAEDIKPFVGGLHCVKPPTPRTFGQFSGGNGVPCGGTFDLDFNAWLTTQPQPTVRAGARIYAQYWYRDLNDPFGSDTSDAVSFHVVH